MPRVRFRNSLVSSGQTSVYKAGGGTLALNDVARPDAFSGAISGFGAGDSFDVAGFGAGTSFSFTENAAHTAGVLSLSIAYGLFFGNVVLLPLWLQQYMGYTATWAGLATAPVGILAILLSPWVGKNVGRIDPRKLATVSFFGFALILWMRSNFNAQADFVTILIPTVVQGAAMAFFFIPLQAIVFSGLPPERMPSAAGLSNFVRITAGAIGTSLFTTVWEDRAALHHAQLSEAVNRGSGAAVQTLAQLQAGGLSAEQALANINRTLDQQAYTMAVTDLFYLSAVLFLCLICVIWLARPQPAAAAAGGGGAH